MPIEKPRLRKREVGIAVIIGGLAAFAGGTMVSEMYENEQRFIAVEQADQASVTYDLAEFDEVSVTGPQDVVITWGDTMSVTAEGESADVDKLEAVVENGRLLIRPREGRFFGDWGDLDEVTYRVTMPRLERIAIAGSGEVVVDRVESETFEAVIGGPGAVVIDTLAADRASFIVTGSGEVDVKGSAREVTVSVSGSGDVSAGGLNAMDASVTIAGSGDVDLNVAQDAAVSITGSGDVEITGPGVCSVTRMGGGEVRCEGGGGDEDVRRGRRG